MKEILFLTRSQFGYQSDYFYYCKYLSGNNKISLICIDARKKKFSPGNIKVFYIKKIKGLDILKFWIKSFLLIIESKPDLIVINSFPFSFLLPIILGPHRFLFDIRSGGVSGNYFKRAIRNFQIKLNISANRNISVLSDSLTQQLKIPKSKYHILPLGAEVFSSKRKTFDKMNLFYIGTLNGRRLGDTILGFSKFYKEYSDRTQISYQIVGDGSIDETLTLKKIIKQEGLNEVIKLHGRLSHIEALKFFDDCNIGVSYLPVNEYYNVQPLTKTFEYICSGLAVIGANTLENAKVINASNGVLVKDSSESFYNGLMELRLNLTHYSSEKIRVSSLIYTWEYIVKNNFIPIIESILN